MRKLLKNKSNGGNSKIDEREDVEPQEDDLEVIKNLKATDKLPHLMEDIPIPGLLTIYIDPEVRTSRVLQEALVDEKSRLDVKWSKSHDFTNDSFYGVTKICLEDANKEVKTMYKAEFHFNRKTIFLGMYSSATEAARAFDRAALAKIGPHAKINFHLSNYTEEGGTNTVSLLGVKRVKESLQISNGKCCKQKVS